MHNHTVVDPAHSARTDRGPAARLAKRVVVKANGGPEVLELVDDAIPEPGLGEVRVCLVAAGVAYVDLMMRIGGYPRPLSFPFTPGCDAVGVVDKIGAGVDRVRIGDRVGAYTIKNGYAEYICLKADDLILIPDGIVAPSAVACILNYGTAWQMLHRVAGLRPGQAILVHGASGGVGTALVQLARRHGLTVYGTASSPKLRFVENLGAIPINYLAEDFATRVFAATNGRGVDAVFDHLGGDHLKRSYSVLARPGFLVCYGFARVIASGVPHRDEIAQTYARVDELSALDPDRRVTLYASIAVVEANRAAFNEDVGHVLQMVVRGEIDPPIDGIYPLTEASIAQRRLESGAATGKIVLNCTGQEVCAWPKLAVAPPAQEKEKHVPNGDSKGGSFDV